MASGAAAGRQPEPAIAFRSVVRLFVELVVVTCLWAALLFISAGRIDWLRAWIYLALSTTTLAVSGVIAACINPGVIAARAKKKREGVKRFDRIFSAMYSTLLLATPVIAGLDAVRFGWSSMPFATVYVGVALYLVGSVPITAALATNPFAERQVRIQSDRDHRVISTGPYRYVRHPLYTGAVVLMFAIPLILGSVWALVIAVLSAAAFVWRTAMEDSTLRAELAGYEEYCSRTRYRLIPGLW